MRIIELNAEQWRTVLDFYQALLLTLGAPEEHGKSVNALIDSMIWGEMNAIDPPYTIRITGTQKLSKDVRAHIELVKKALVEARVEFRTREGHDVEVNFEIEP